MKKQMIVLFVVISVLPSIFLLLLGLWVLILVLASIQDLTSLIVAAIFLTIWLGGVLGIVGLLRLALKVTAEEPMQPMNYKLKAFLSLGIFTAIGVGSFFLFADFMISAVVFAPVLMTVFLIDSYRRRLESCL